VIKRSKHSLNNDEIPYYQIPFMRLIDWNLSPIRIKICKDLFYNATDSLSVWIDKLKEKQLKTARAVKLLKGRFVGFPTDITDQAILNKAYLVGQEHHSYKNI
jgi:hypothetical protein